MLAPVVVGTIIFMVWGEAFLHELGTDTHRRTQTFCPADMAVQKMQSASGGISLMFS